jgi:hypothetical protein
MTQPTTALRRTIGVALLACGGGLLAACSSAAPSATPTVTVTTSPPTPSAPATATPTPVSSASTSAAAGGSAGVASCATSALRLHLSGGDGAAGSVYVEIRFTNTSGSACTLFGFPGVSFVSAPGGSQIGSPADKSPALARKLITLGPGDEAHTGLQVVEAENFPQNKCQLVHAHWLKVYPPGQTAAKYLHTSFDTCSGTSKAVHTMFVQAARTGPGQP